jgi:hypothetical protein
MSYKDNIHYSHTKRENLIQDLSLLETNDILIAGICPQHERDSLWILGSYNGEVWRKSTCHLLQTAFLLALQFDPDNCSQTLVDCRWAT